MDQDDMATPFHILPASPPKNDPRLSTASPKEAVCNGTDNDGPIENLNNMSVDALHHGSSEHEEPDGIMMVEETTTQVAWYKNPHQITAMVSNFSTSYNVVNISLVLPILQQLYPTHSAQDTAASASSLLAGMIVGQLVGGALGDSQWLGRLGALLLVMSLQIFASLGSAFLFWGSNKVNGADIYLWLALWRFVLGIGAGGVYPLAAVLSAEQGGSSSSSNHHNEDTSSQVHRVVLTFSTQGLGFVMVPIVAVGLLHTIDNLDLVWRCILGLGSVPGIVLMILQWRLYDSQCSSRTGLQPVPSNEEDDNEPFQSRALSSSDAVVAVNNSSTELDIPALGNNASSSRCDSIRNEPNLGQKLLGTAGAWFLFDVLFYGNTIFQPIVVEAAFGETESESSLHLLQQTALHSLILTSIALPGYAVAGISMGGSKESQNCCTTQSPRYVMLQGFAAMGFLYSCIGWNWSYLRHYPVILVSLYGMTFFFANYGPNTTTFIMPSLLYSPECRSTLNGISAACGKLGALAGATLFEPAATRLGDSYVMMICATISVMAWSLTYCCLPSSSRSSSASPSPRHAHAP
jgi:MFS transporter, PHS family, inorganic phosphate transporter